MSALGLILLLGLAAPQDQPASAQQTGDQNAAPQIFTAETLKQIERHAFEQALASSFGRRPIPQHSLKQIEQRTLDQAFASASGRLQAQRYFLQRGLIHPSGPACFAIRSYIFNRKNGNAPVLVSTTTCTPSDTTPTLDVARPAR